MEPNTDQIVAAVAAAPADRPSAKQLSNKTKRKSTKNRDHSSKRCRKSKIGLSDLPDDCLNAIMRHLNADQLNAAASTCTRFQSIAGPVFKLKPGSEQLDIANKLKAVQRHRNDRRTPPIILKWYLRNFGHLIADIELQRRKLPEPFIHLADELFTFIVVYCIGALKTLRLRGMELTAKAIDSAHLLFMHLKTLHVDNHLNLAEVLPMCQHLEELHIDCIDGSVPIDLDAYNFAQLRAFQLRAYKEAIGVNLGALNNFIHRHTNLESFSINTPVAYRIDINRIGQLANMETLELFHSHGVHDGYTVNLALLSDLTKLKSLNTNFPTSNLSEFLMESKSSETIERLLLRQPMVMDRAFVEGFSRFRNMQFIEFTVERLTYIADALWQPLENVKKIAEMKLSCTGIDMTMFLQHLGSTNTLKKFKLDDFVASDALFRAINRYSSLGLLTLTQSIDMNNGHFDLLNNLENVSEFQLRIPYSTNDIGHEGIVAIVRHLKALRVMKLYDSPSLLFMSNATLNAVGRICQENKREMVMKCDPKQKFCIINFELNA